MARSRLLLLLLMVCFPSARAYALAMQISNISDFAPPTWSMGDPAITTAMDLCIYGLNIPALTSYAITVSSSPAGYNLVSGSKTIPFSLYWNDGGPGNLTGTGTQLSDGVKVANLQHVNILSSSCAVTGPNARLTMKITQADMTAALSGTYSGTLTLLLSPN